MASLEGGLGSTSPPAAMSCLSGLESFSVDSAYRIACLLLRGGSVAGIAPMVAIIFVLLAGADAIDCVCRRVRRCTAAAFSDVVSLPPAPLLAVPPPPPPPSPPPLSREFGAPVLLPLLATTRPRSGLPIPLIPPRNFPTSAVVDSLPLASAATRPVRGSVFWCCVWSCCSSCSC